MGRKTIIMLVGLPRAGKTTLIKQQLAKGCSYPVVSADAIRAAIYNLRFVPKNEPLVWWIVRIMVEALFFYHDTIIIDSTAVTKARRDYWNNPEEWDTKFVVMKTPAEECIRRAAQQNDGGIVRTIERMANEWEDLTKDEAFRALDPEGDW